MHKWVFAVHSALMERWIWQSSIVIGLRGQRLELSRMEANSHCHNYLFCCWPYLWYGWYLPWPHEAHSITEQPHIQWIISHDISCATKPNSIASIQFANSWMMNRCSRILIQSAHSLRMLWPCQHKANWRNTVICTNCKCNGHSATYCVFPGWIMAGKSINESKQTRHHDCGVQQATSTNASDI